MIAIHVSQSWNNALHPPLPREFESFDALAREFSTFPVFADKMAAPLFTPGNYREGTTTRIGSAFKAAHVAVFDLDRWTSEELATHLEKLNTLGLSYFVHSSHSYAPPARAKVRIVFELSEPIEVGSPLRWKAEIHPRLLQYLGLEDASDRQCVDAARGYFLPSRGTETSPTLFIRHAGAPIDVQALLGDVLARPVEYVPTVTRVRRTPTENAAPVDLNALGIEMATYAVFKDHRRVEAVTTVLKGEPFLETGGKGRHERIRDVTIAIANVAQDDQEDEDLIEIMRPTLEATEDTCPGRDWWGDASRALAGARDNRSTYLAQRAQSAAESAQFAAALEQVAR